MPYNSIYGGTSGIKVPNSNKVNPFAGDFQPGQYLVKNQPSQPKQSQPKIQQPKPQPQSQPKPTLFSKVKSGVKSVAKSAAAGENVFATGIARDLPGGTNDLKAEEQAANQAVKTQQQVKRMIQSGKINANAGAKIIKSQASNASQASKETSDIVKKMPSKKQIALGAASTAADIITAGSLPELKAARATSLTSKLVRGGTQAGAFGTAGALNAAAAGGNKKQIAENFVAGAAAPGLFHVAGKFVQPAVSKTRSLLSKVPQIIGKPDEAKVAQGVYSAAMKTTPTKSISIAADDVHKVDSAKVAQYVKQIKDGEPIEPIVTHEVNGQTFVVDGQQRLAAARKLGITDIPTVEKTPGEVNVHPEPVAVAEAKVATATKEPVANTKPANAEPTALPAEGSMPKTTEATPAVNKSNVPRTREQIVNDIQANIEAAKQATGHAPGEYRSIRGSKSGAKSNMPTAMKPFWERHEQLRQELSAPKTAEANPQKQVAEPGEPGRPAKISNRKESEQKANGQEPVNVAYTEPKESPIPQVRTTKLSQGVETNAIKKGLTDGFEGKTEYLGVNIDEQTKAAADLVKGDPARALRVALGHEHPPEGLLPESVFIAVENAATKVGDADLLRKLATESHLTAEASGMGQRIRMLGEREGTSPTAAIQKVQKARAEAFEKRSGKTVSQAVDDEIKKIKAAKVAQPVTKETWGSFVDSLKC